MYLLPQEAWQRKTLAPHHRPPGELSGTDNLRQKEECQHVQRKVHVALSKA